MRGVDSPLFREATEHPEAKRQFYAVLNGDRKSTDPIQTSYGVYRFVRRANSIQMERVSVSGAKGVLVAGEQIESGDAVVVRDGKVFKIS